MKPVTRPLIALLLALLCQAPARAQTLDKFDINQAYPLEVILVEEGDKGYAFRLAANMQRLYFSDLDSGGRSACNAACTRVTPPVFAPADAKPLGDWTVTVRYDGQRQWAYRGKPLYTFIHDTPQHPQIDGLDGVWHLLPIMKPINP